MMPADERVRFTQQLENKIGADWFNNIQDILRFSGNHDLDRSGTWFSHVDANILVSIQEGLNNHLGAKANLGIGGARQWSHFFDLLSGGASEDQLYEAWGTAEQLATDYGVAQADALGLTAGRERDVLMTFGNVYRAGVKNHAAGEIAGGLGGGVYSAIAGGLACGPAMPLCSAFGFVSGTLGGSAVADSFLDPRTEGTTLIAAEGLYQSLTHPLLPPAPLLPSLIGR